MKSSEAGQASWTTTDGSAWWLRDAQDVKYNEPSGNYHANCYLYVYNVYPDNVGFTDAECHPYSTEYLCQKALKVAPAAATTNATVPVSTSEINVTSAEVSS